MEHGSSSMQPPEHGFDWLGNSDSKEEKTNRSGLFEEWCCWSNVMVTGVSFDLGVINGSRSEQDWQYPVDALA
ncbi:hypothetical protein E3N88_00518 [Mikania micrantha]|uniref:Uncharacterized protein n=1 Tax=Mikania micrantha TaxID=192012 RepID=A0A5N6PYN6_9ASTR|nr:hypothetical protein E3N88_00518 [Mikania micrantha]